MRPLKMIIEAGFSRDLLLHEYETDTGKKENVLDIAINKKDKLAVIDYLLSDDERRKVFLSSDKRQNYLSYIEQISETSEDKKQPTNHENYLQ